MKALGFLRAKQEWESGNKGINHLKQSESGLCCCTCRTPPRNKWQAMPLLERARKAWGEWPGSVSLRQSSGESFGWIRSDLVQISAPPLTSSVTLGTFLNLLEPHL